MILKHTKVWKPLAQRFLAGIDTLWGGAGRRCGWGRWPRKLPKDLWQRICVRNFCKVEVTGTTKRKEDPLNLVGKVQNAHCMSSWAGQREIRSSLRVHRRPPSLPSRCLHLCLSVLAAILSLNHIVLFGAFLLSQKAISKRTVLSFLFVDCFLSSQKTFERIVHLWVFLSWLYYKDIPLNVHPVMC